MNQKKALFVTFTLLSLFLLSGCQKTTKKKVIATDTVTIQMTQSQENALDIAQDENIQKWHITNKRICVVLGYDFNDSETTNNYLYILEQEFGLSNEGGLVDPVIFPDSFKHGTKTYVSDFKEILKNNYKDTDLIGLILLGAPENTHIVLENLQDENELYFPVIALFPQDDILGLESTCDMIVEKSQSVEEASGSNAEESISALVAKAPEILLNAISYLETLDEMRVSFNDIEDNTQTREGILSKPFPTDSDMIQHVARILKGQDFAYYIDPDTGISSFNHFVIK